MELLIGIIAGGLVSWIISHAYYRKSSKAIPEWAKPIVAKLPDTPPSKERLIELFQEALENGEIHPDPVFGHVACPKCKAPSDDFRKQSYNNEPRGDVIVVECPHCGWSDSTEM